MCTHLTPMCVCAHTYTDTHNQVNVIICLKENELSFQPWVRIYPRRDKVAQPRASTSESQKTELENESPQGKVHVHARSSGTDTDSEEGSTERMWVQTHLIKINLEVVKVKERCWDGLRIPHKLSHQTAQSKIYHSHSCSAQVSICCT